MAEKTGIDFVVVEENALLDFQFSLVDAMNEAGVTKAELARMLGVSRARVSQLLVSEANPTIKLVARTLAIVGRSLRFVSKGESTEVVSPSEDGQTNRWESLVTAARAVDSEWAVEQHSRGPANKNDSENARYAWAA